MPTRDAPGVGTGRHTHSFPTPCREEHTAFPFESEDSHPLFNFAGPVTQDNYVGPYTYAGPQLLFPTIRKRYLQPFF